MSTPHSLRNHLDRKTLKTKLSQENHSRKTLSFYRYVPIQDPHRLRNELFEKWSALGVLGRIYVAHEGINAQFSVPETHFDEFVNSLEDYSELAAMPLKIALEEPTFSFFKLAIKVKKQIVMDGLSSQDYDLSNIGTHLEPAEFHSMIHQPDTVVVDMRNHYESVIGRFEGAVCPPADTFREALPMVRDLLKEDLTKKVLLYCTGGIRCEKASAYLKHHGFKNVYQLSGGIIRYAEYARETGMDSQFKGKNFVFDDRRAEKVTEDVLAQCAQCAGSCDRYVNCANEMCNLLFIQCEACEVRLMKCCSDACIKIASLADLERRRYRRSHQKPQTHEKYCKSLHKSCSLSSLPQAGI